MITLVWCISFFKYNFKEVMICFLFESNSCTIDVDGVLTFKPGVTRIDRAMFNNQQELVKQVVINKDIKHIKDFSFSNLAVEPPV